MWSDWRIWVFYEGSIYVYIAQAELCPNTELFLVRIFLYSDWIRRDTPYLSVFSPNTGKNGPEKSLYLDTSRSDG